MDIHSKIIVCTTLDENGNVVRKDRFENESHRNIEVMWLIRKLTPDFKIIADLRKNNVDSVKLLFRKFNLFLKDQGLFKSHDVAVDGTKIKAVNSMDRSCSRERLRKTLEAIEEKIEKYLHEMDETDGIEEDIDREKITRAIEKLRKKKKELKGAEISMNSSDTNEISLTDPEARQINTRHGVDVCFNGHIAVESENHLITYYTIDNSTNDYASVFPLAKGAKEFIDRFSIFADKGHFSLPNLLSLAQEGIEAFIPSPQRGNPGKRKEVPERDYHRSRFLYDPLKDTYRCPEGNEMHYRFSTPNSTRPEIVYRVYTTDACFTCAVKNRCTNSVRRKWMERWEHADVEDQHWKRMNSRGVEKMILRKRTVEHPFGTIKRAMNQGYFLLKGLRKVKSEFGFSVIAYNMKRAISIKGV